MRCRVAGLLLVFAAVACTRREDPRPAPFQPPAPRVSASTAPGARLPAEERTWSFPQTSVGRMSVVVVVPERAEGERFPVLIALHGRGETLKGPERGARGWVADYALGRAAERLAPPPPPPPHLEGLVGAPRPPPLSAHDFEGFVEAPRLTLLNSALAAVPYRGLIVVCPYLPDVLSSDDPFAQAPQLAHFLVDELIPKVNAETPALGTPAATGIDGVSLGGRGAITVGLLRPEAFGAVASLQAALDPRNASDIVARA